MISAAPVPPLPSHQLLILLLQVGVLLLSATVLGKLAAHVRLPAVVGELCAGVLLGPTVLGHLSGSLFLALFPADPAQFHLLDGVGQFGLILLIGITGVEIDLDLVRRRSSQALTIGTTGLVIPLALGTCAGYLVPATLIPTSTSRAVFALFLGTALCVSAIPVIAKTLTDMNLLHRNIGQLILSAAMVDDIGGWFLLSIISALAVGGSGADGTLWWSIPRTLVVLIAAVLLARPVILLLMRWAARSGPLQTIALGTVVMFLSAAATQALNLEAMIGAFLAGTIIGTAGPDIRTTLMPLRQTVLAVLAPFFFATAGLRIDLGALRHPSVLGLAILVLSVAVAAKFAGAFIGARAHRLSRWEGLALGAGLNSRGVIQIVIATAGLRLGVLTGSTYTVIILIAIVTSAMAPPVLAFAMRRIHQTSEEHMRLHGRAPAREVELLPPV